MYIRYTIKELYVWATNGSVNIHFPEEGTVRTKVHLKFSTGTYICMYVRMYLCFV